MTIFSSDRRSIIEPHATRHRCRFAFSLVASLVVALTAIAVTTTPATAQVLTWDPNGASAGTGGDGSWNTTSLFWTGTSGTRAWASGTAGFLLDAYFGGTSGTVTVTTPLSFNDIRFDSNYVLTGSALSVGPQGGTTVFTVNSGVTAEIQNVLVFPTVGFMTWNKRGLGTLMRRPRQGLTPHVASAVASGMVTENTEPCPTSEVTLSWQCSASAIVRQMARPRP